MAPAPPRRCPGPAASSARPVATSDRPGVDRAACCRRRRRPPAAGAGAVGHEPGVDVDDAVQRLRARRQPVVGARPAGSSVPTATPPRLTDTRRTPESPSVAVDLQRHDARASAAGQQRPAAVTDGSPASSSSSVDAAELEQRAGQLHQPGPLAGRAVDRQLEAARAGGQRRRTAAPAWRSPATASSSRAPPASRSGTPGSCSPPAG